MDLGQQLAYITVLIVGYGSNDTQSLGTGFLYREPFPDREGFSINVVITNRHVIEGTQNGRIVFHLTSSDSSKVSPSPESKGILFKNWEPRWFMHPNADIDLTCMPLGDVSVQMDESGFKRFEVSFGPHHIPTEESISTFQSIEDVLMVGYPIGLWDEVHNLPLIRRGVTAPDPKIDFNGRSEFVVDIASFPGSSGSPVVRPNREGNLGARWPPVGGVVRRAGL